MKKSLIISVFTACFISAGAQDLTLITGRITDSLTGDPLIGAGIVTGEKSGTTTDADGIYAIRTTEKEIHLIFSYLGYRTAEKTIRTGTADTIVLDVLLQRSVTALDEIVVSAGKYEQKLSDVMVSIDIIQPERITNTGTISLEDLLRQTPGMEILDGQPGIRGGSGYSYGAGSRVLVLMDGLPILTGDVGDVKWDYLPVENIEQVEIIKGASSVLYGSSALNGIVDIRTRYPVNKPRTRLSLYSGLYMDPARREMIWWDRNPLFAGFDFSHSRKIRNLDLVLGGNLFRDEGYREDEYKDRVRMNVGLKHRNRKVGGLSYGINMNGMWTDKSDFLLWRDAYAGAWRQNPLSVSALYGSRFNLDPFIDYRTPAGGQHSLRSRYFRIDNNFPEASDKDNQSGQLYVEYKYHRKFAERIESSLGAAVARTNSVAALYGNHSSFNQAVFGQVDAHILGGLNASLGLRFERYVLDGEVEYSTPVFRAGLNYRLADHSYLRASYGQGYRFPSVAEKYTATYVGAVQIFPNPDLVSETGWSSEIGFKQGLKLGDWHGYFDMAAFWTEYSDMIEFLFGIHGSDSLIQENYGFKALNVGNARITGLEFTLYGSGQIKNIPVSIVAGYTCINPVDRNPADSAVDEQSKYLKYRYRHSLKSDAEISYKRFTLGFTVVYNSRMERIDEVFTNPEYENYILPGFIDYWEAKNTGYTVLDARFLCDITSFLRVGLVARNVLNKEYMGRPGDIQPPRNLTLRLTADF